MNCVHLPFFQTGNAIAQGGSLPSTRVHAHAGVPLLLALNRHSHPIHGAGECKGGAARTY
eukprot:1213788-Alexandrium_andersonii.AAC.1